MKLLTPLISVLLITSVVSSAAAENNCKTSNTAVLTAVKNGNDHELFSSIKKFLELHPSSPFAALYYSDIVSLSGIAGFKKSEKLLLSLIDREKNSTDRDRNLRLLRLNLMLEKLYYRHNSRSAADVTARISPVRSWKLYGPYHKYGYADMGTPFAPETGAADDRGAAQVYLKNRSGILEPEKFIYPGQGTLYAVTSFNAAPPFKIRVQSSAYYKIFINGKEIFTNSGENYLSERTLVIKGIQSAELMIKTLRLSGEAWNFRVFITDINDKTILPVYNDQAQNNSEFTFTEEQPFPADRLTALKNEKPGMSPMINFYLANMYHELGSTRADIYYRESLAARDDKLVSLFHSLLLLDTNRGNRASPDYIKGLRNLNELCRDDPPFIPALNRRFRYYFSFNDFTGAYRAAKQTVSVSPFNHTANFNFSNLLIKMNYTGEALNAIEQFKTRFPESAEPLLLEAGMYRDRDPQRSLRLMEQALEKIYSPGLVRDIIELLKNTGEYEKAAALASRFNSDGDFNIDIIELHLTAGNIKTANSLLSQEIASKTAPYTYYLKGKAAEKSGTDGLLYYQKAFHLNNSAFSIYDYAHFLENGTVKNPFEAFDDFPVDNPFTLLRESDKKYPSVVLSSKKILMLLNHGASRVFCEDIIYTGTRKGVNRWADYTLPFKGRIYPLSARVYSADGTYTDTYTLQEINGEYHINFSSVNPGSIIRLAYISDNPVERIRSADMFSSRFYHAQNYDEPCLRHTLKVIYPSSKKLYFHSSGAPSENTEERDGYIIKSFIHKNLPAVSRERFNGSSLNALPFMAFTEMRDLDEFSVWYNGLLPERDKNSGLRYPPELKVSENKTSVVNVYNFISKKIDSAGTSMFYPGDPADVLKSGRGSVEDKVILAQRILSEMGITSYPAFVSSRSYPVIKDFISPGIYSNILLFVPLGNEELWLDFSNRFFPAGITDSELKGREAVIVKENYFEKKIITYTDSTLKSSVFHAVLDTKGNARCSFSSKFEGRYAEIKSFFKRKDYHEEAVYKYFSAAVSTLIIDKYSVTGYEHDRSGLEIKAEGYAAGVTTIAGNKLIIQPVFNKSGIYRYILYPERKQQLVIYSDINEIEEYYITLPHGYSKKEISRSSVIDSRNGKAEIRFEKKKGESVIAVTKKIHVKSAVIQPDEYGEFLKFCSDLKQAESANLVIGKD